MERSWRCPPWPRSAAIRRWVDRALYAGVFTVAARDAAKLGAALGGGMGGRDLRPAMTVARRVGVNENWY